MDNHYFLEKVKSINCKNWIESIRLVLLMQNTFFPLLMFLIAKRYITQRMLGPLVPEHMAMFLRNPRFFGLKFPDMSNPETLEKRYLGKLSRQALLFMKVYYYFIYFSSFSHPKALNWNFRGCVCSNQSCLRMDSNARITAEEALEHPFFEGLAELYPSTVSLIPRRPRSGRDRSLSHG